MYRCFTFLLIVSVTMIGCRASEAPSEEVVEAKPNDATLPEGDPEKPPPEQVVSGTGVVQFVDIEGGFYGIVVDDTARYNPTNLAPEFRQDGLDVRFRGVLREDVMTTQMWGRNIELIDIQRIGSDD